jgi:hypothetical protein
VIVKTVPREPMAAHRVIARDKRFITFSDQN